ncbi:hypothetical protein LIER_41294 [Lithospermum erythrorhizon]|uniref:Endonuclease/exonuclease/phosphatase domain-containing protein n=1 Tax=Lithospermum erythrorhizon TaxID=34254 RepID=A0AAV3R8K5_LITER
MGAICIEFASQSAPFSPKSMARAEEGSREGKEKSGLNLEECHVSLESMDIISPESYRTTRICLSKEAVDREKFPALGIIEKAVVAHHRQYLHLKLTNLTTAKLYYITVVYVFCNIPERMELWEALSNIQKFSTPWIVMGDFNKLISGDERIGGNALDPVSMFDFSQCIQNCKLIDVGFVGSK